MWIGIGVGCLVLALVVVVGGCWYCTKKTGEAFEEAAGGMGQIGAEMSRISLSLNLEGVKMSCSMDPSGAGAANYFHATIFPTYQSQACQVNTPGVVEAFSRSCQSQPQQRPCSDVAIVTGTDADLATGLGLNAQTCYAYTSGSAKIIACNTDLGYKFIHFENVTAVQ
jgi:hypothetical protein